MGIMDLKAKLAGVANAVKASVATAATERITKAKAKAQERAKKAEEAREQKYLLDAGWTPEIGQKVAELEELYNLREEVRKIQADARRTASADRERLTAEADASLKEVEDEIATYETDPEVAFFGWYAWIERQTEKPDRKLALEEIGNAIADGYTRDLPGEEADRIRAEAQKAKAEGREPERSTPFFTTVRVKPRPSDLKKGEAEPFTHFHCVSGGMDFYARNTESARKRLVFFALQDLWRAVVEARKAEYRNAQDVKAHCHIAGADVAAGQTGQAWAEVTAEKPWLPTTWDNEAKKRVPKMKDGRPVVNYGPFVLESPKPGIVRVLNLVPTGMFYPLLFAGAWEQDGEGKFIPVDFKFFPGKNPKTGFDNNFAGLRPVKDEIERSSSQLSRLRAIFCLGSKLETPERAEETDDEPVSEGKLGEEYTAPAAPSVQLETKPKTERGKRREDKPKGKGRKGGRPQAEEDAPDLSRVSTLSDAQKAAGESDTDSGGEESPATE